MAANKKRREPEPIPAVEAGGIRYEAPLMGAVYGFQQDGGIVVALDAASGLLNWTQKVYLIEYNDDIEHDKQDVFISRMVLTEDGTGLLIDNELGARFKLTFADRSVVDISSNEN